MTECEAVLLGREQVHGSANGATLAALCRSLMRKPDLRRKYVLRCHRDDGLRMTPYRRLDDEGFESDEDRTSLGSSSDDTASIYVSDHALRLVKARTTDGASPAANPAPRSSSQSSGAPHANGSGGSVSSVGTDSANSSGASDNDETDTSLGHNVNHGGGPVAAAATKSSAAAAAASASASFDKTRPPHDVECFAYHEIAFCHTDPSLPNIIVWVIKTRRPAAGGTSSAEYTYGLEAVVFLCHSEQKFRALYNSFQEYSRRQKLEKPLRSRWKDEFKGGSTIARAPAAAAKPSGSKGGDPGGGGGGAAAANAVMYNLVQRVDTDGVTHIEVTRPPADVRPAAPPEQTAGAGEPSSIISINTPDSGNVLTPKKPDKLIDGVIRADEPPATTVPPERPERKKHQQGGKSLLDKEKMAVVYAAAAAPPNREKVVKGQYVRVSVDQKTLSSPSSRPGWLFGGGGGDVKPAAVLSYPSRLVWSRADAENYNLQQLQQQQLQHKEMLAGGGGDSTVLRRSSRKTDKEQQRERRRSKSSVSVLRRPDSPKRYPMPHRYADAIQINNSLPNRFFGRLKELTGGGGGGHHQAGAQHHHHHQHKFKRRNSIGDLANGGGLFYQQPALQQAYGGDAKRGDKGGLLTKSTPNLKSMIKNKNGAKFCKEGYGHESEPTKKVTFSAYATVQVVD